MITKKLIVRAIKLAVIVLLFLSLPYLVFFIRMALATNKMAATVIQTGKLTEDIYTALNTKSNVYLIKSKDGYIAIDSGNNEQRTLQAMKKLGVSPDEVKVVLLTHSDLDHVGGVGLFKQAKVFISKEESAILKGEIYRKFGWFNIPVPCLKTFEYETLEDKQILSFGSRKIECFLTPGHTPGHMCFLIDDQYLFTGDMISIENGRARSFVELFTMDSNLNKKSIKSIREKIKSRPIKYIFTAHFGYSKNFEEAFRDF